MFGLCQKSWSSRARISNNRFFPATVQDGRQLPLTHVPHLLNEAEGLNPFNADFTQFCLPCMFGPPKHGSDNRLCEPISIRCEVRRENLESSRSEKSALKSAINCQSIASLQSQAIESKHNHLNLGAPQFPELYAFNHHSSAHSEMTSYYAFIPLLHIAVNPNIN